MRLRSVPAHDPRDRSRDIFGGRTTLHFDGAVVKFVEPIDADGTGVIGVDIAVADPAAVMAKARAAKLPLKGDSIWICGTAITPVAG